MSPSVARYTLGVDLGGTKILAGIVDPAGKVLSHTSIPTIPNNASIDEDGLTNRIANIVRKVVLDAGCVMDEILAVGCSAPGPVNFQSGRVITAPNISCWKEGYDLGPELQKRLNLPVTVDNDVNLGTLGETTYGAARGYSDVVGIFVGTGIGGGILIDGKIRRGRRWLAGEVGHITVDRNGPPCCCGLKGHTDSLAAGGPINRRLKAAAESGESPILRSLFRQSDTESIPSDAILKAIADGDFATRRIIQDAQEVIGVLIATVVNLIDPECVILGGGVIENLGQPFLEGIREAALANIFLSELSEPVRILPAALGQFSVLLGCAALSRNEYVFSALPG